MQFYEESVESIENSRPTFEFSTVEERELHYKPSPEDDLYLTDLNDQLMHIYEHLEDYKYEIDNHMTDFDSLHFLAESIKKYKLKLWTTQNTHNRAHWDSVEQYVEFVSDIANAVENTTKTHRFDAMKFLETQHSKNKVQQSNFY